MLPDLANWRLSSEYCGDVKNFPASWNTVLCLHHCVSFSLRHIGFLVDQICTLCGGVGFLDIGGGFRKCLVAPG